MDFIFRKKQNVVIESHQEHSGSPIDDMLNNDIDMNDKDAVIKERARIVKVMSGYSYFETPRAPFDMKDYGYERKAEYIKDKADWRANYIHERDKIYEKARFLEQRVTALCREEKKVEDDEAIANGTFYNADELAALDEMNDDKKERRNKQLQEASKKYYDKNKDKIQIKRKVNKLNKELTTIENKDINQKLVKSNTIIKPQCLCGCDSNVTKLKDIKTHSKLVKHQLFKSIIKLVHYKRGKRRIFNVTREINKMLADGKRLERFKKEKGGWGTRVERPNKETIIYFNDMCEPYDESTLPTARKSTQDKKEYTRKYKDKKLLLANQLPSKKGRPKED